MSNQGGIDIPSLSTMLDLNPILLLSNGLLLLTTLLLLEPLLFSLFGLRICSSTSFEMIGLYYEA
jgi:hypothetical protein